MSNESPAPAVFDAYARYYDLLYRDKDYAGEAQFVHQKLQAHGVPGPKLLELGAGTGRHGVELHRLGYEVTGVDLSENMIAQARSRVAGLRGAAVAAPHFEVGDIRTVRLARTFDAVISLFHVISYQVTLEDLRAAVETAAQHLRRDGVLIFDFWYGPAVLSDPPTVRVKRLEDDAIKVTRIAEPDFMPNENRVAVNYQVLMQNKADGVISEIRETHTMRYLFLPEIRALLSEQNLGLVDSGAWRAERPLGRDTWYGWVAAKIGR